MSSANSLAIDLESVSYTYPQSHKIALADISYTFPAGVTAIVGPNGAGKSTLVKLVTGLLAPTRGAISVRLPGGACLPPDHAHRAVLFQEPSHLYLTIRQNVTMRFEKTASEDARIHEALEMAGLGRVVAGLPEGIDTLVGAGFGGRLDLSGGQWQRLALARLIYQDAPVMILDEPVASLDPEGERAVFELFAQLNRAKVILFTTHRYDSIPAGTRIVVLVDGRVAEVGTHEELLRQQHHYWSLYMACGPKVGDSLGSGPGAPAPEWGMRVPDSTIRTLEPKVPPASPPGGELFPTRVRRFGTRLVRVQERTPSADAHGGNHDVSNRNGAAAPGNSPMPQAITSGGEHVR